ncbi:hypothetical protein AWT69_003222 [Pseudomonas putida]|nr:hypothetical protein AWT69_003222 [Pseudomonas putida]
MWGQAWQITSTQAMKCKKGPKRPLRACCPLPDQASGAALACGSLFS